MSTYVYGIIRASHSSLPQDMDGIGDPPRPVRVLRQGELAAIVSEAPEELRPKRRDLLAHHRVLDAAGADGVVLPMRFGSASPDDDTVTTVLAERAEHLLERLAALDGKAEYNVKANHNEEAVLHLVMADNDDVRMLAEANREAGGGSHEEKVRLGEMVTAAVQAREATDAELLQQALEPTAEAVSVGPQSTGWLANLSFLVNRGSAEQFLTAVDGLRQEHPHLELRVHGPLPPYSFVDTSASQQAEGSTAEAFGADTAQPTNG
ncbi:GvpL/GvpF family gas vesicle protein [Streptomyces lomondensis]|uniref:Gas vesicle protein n=1 Tax=Streptomyces lomondensis TaxID=68229 RepID=A0ABQ2XSY0_9ACTN|nr:GvpL/GvpF family gas vesicle protein [Streptomyces lomondensis]MCF0083121.1 GvpL/GvpF family gas vesicle protein [Streptomyces lomondensis]GGX31614.1 gas vesicle protein [Streptomyces lomondensis]